LKELSAAHTDQETLPTLIQDLESRGLLESTLVVWVGEFGRAPKINKLAGARHWPQCYTALLAGGGVKPGAIHVRLGQDRRLPGRGRRATRRSGRNALLPAGIDPHTEVADALNRPLPISRGNPIEPRYWLEQSRGKTNTKHTNHYENHTNSHEKDQFKSK